VSYQVAQIVENQYNVRYLFEKSSITELASQCLRLSRQVDHKVLQGKNIKQVIREMRKTQPHDSPLLSILRRLNLEISEDQIIEARIEDLATGMTLAKEVHTTDGTLFLQIGHKLTPTVIERIKRFTKNKRIRPPFVVTTENGLPC
jgi:hypothetical protein